MEKVLVIVGPTASGKTSLGVRCAKEFNGEVISGDSIQIYRGLDIGSAKVTKQEMQGVKHHLIDIKDANENYSVKEFQEKGRELIEQIIKEGKLPIVVGGTGLYIKALLYDYTFFEEKEKDEEYEDLTNQEIYDILLKEDPKSLEKIHVNNRKRLVRALNVLRKHGKGISEISSQQEHRLLYDAKIIGMTRDTREELYSLIDKRIDLMMSEGLLSEVKSLIDSGVGFDKQSMQGIGYREFAKYFSGEVSLNEVVQQIKLDTRHFAKRQYTWFNNQMSVEWHNNISSALASIKDWMC